MPGCQMSYCLLFFLIKFYYFVPKLFCTKEPVFKDHFRWFGYETKFFFFLQSEITTRTRLSDETTLTTNKL